MIQKLKNKVHYLIIGINIILGSILVYLSLLRTLKVDFNSILFIQAYGDYVKIFTEDLKIMTSQTMKIMEDILPSDKFSRVHRSYIIAMDKISLIYGNTVKIKEFEIPVGKSYRTGFFE